MRLTVLVTAFFVALLSAPQATYACSCLYIEDEQERRELYYQQAEVVIQGTVLDEKELDNSRVFAVSIEKVWKGQPDAYIDLHTAMDSAQCGVTLEGDGTYVIFASTVEGELRTSLCSGTRLADSNPELVSWLNNYDGTSSSSSSTTSSLISSTGSSVSSLENLCDPYRCRNGEVFPACENGQPINYFAPPCQFSGGELEPGEELETEEPPADEFIDVTEDNPNYSAIIFVKQEGIVAGYSDGTYRPNQLINRAEFTKIIMGAAFSSDVIPVCNELFSDVSVEDWFAEYVCHAKQRDVISGYPDGTFGPANNVNFAEAAKIVVNAFGIPTSPEDDDEDVWWKPYVFALARINGLPMSFSDPNQELTRGDMAEIVYRVMTGMEQ